MTHTVIRQSDRYGDTGKGHFPEVIILPNCTNEAAQNLASLLSNHYPGCDYLWYVIGLED